MNIDVSELPAEMNFSNMNSSTSNATQVTAMDYYNWCTTYHTAALIWSGFAVICYLLGFPASLIVLHELLQRQRQRASIDIFMFSLALIDLTFTSSVPFGLCNYIIWHNLEFEWISNFIYCLTLAGRPLFMACICGDCYMAVIYPIMYMTSKRIFAIKAVISVTVWIAAVIFGSLLSSLHQLITTPCASIPLIIALPVIAYCNISVLQALRKPDPSGKSNIHPQKKRALHTILNSLIMTFIAYLPPAIIFSFGTFMMLTEMDRVCGLVLYGFCFSMAGCVIMPILYLDSVGKLDTLKEWWKHWNNMNCLMHDP